MLEDRNSEGVFAIHNTRFIFKTNFSGDPTRDRFGDNRRKCNIVVPTLEQVEDLRARGVNVRATKLRPNEDPESFEPEYFVTAQLKYTRSDGEPVSDRHRPHVYLITANSHGGNTNLVPLDEESVGILDSTWVKNVNVTLRPYVYDEAAMLRGDFGVCLYICVLYVEQNFDDDPFASIYARADEQDEEEIPF